jgi:hypothetical protein
MRVTVMDVGVMPAAMNEPRLEVREPTVSFNPHWL